MQRRVSCCLTFLTTRLSKTHWLHCMSLLFVVHVDRGIDAILLLRPTREGFDSTACKGIHSKQQGSAMASKPPQLGQILLLRRYHIPQNFQDV